jgi:hypothetical protein
LEGHQIHIFEARVLPQATYTFNLYIFEKNWQTQSAKQFSHGGQECLFFNRIRVRVDQHG